MLINACGVTKREYQRPHHYNTMGKDEVEKRYFQMVKANLIKGVEEELDDDEMQFVDTNYIRSGKCI